ALAGVARGEARRKVAVVEFRGGVEQAAGLAQRLADRLKKTAALTVLSPIEARQRLGRIDAEVARCAGDEGCLAKLGTRLDVDEAKVMAQLSEVLPPSEEIDDKKLGAWLKQLYPPEVFKRYGFIVVTANIDGAMVTINGQEKGETPLEGKVRVLAPRSYRVDL